VAAQGVSATFEEILRKCAKTGADSFHSHPHAFTDIHLGTQREEAQSLPVFNVNTCATSPLSFVLQQSTNRLNIKSVSASVFILFVKLELADWTGGEPFDKPT